MDPNQQPQPPQPPQFQPVPQPPQPQPQPFVTQPQIGPDPRFTNNGKNPGSPLGIASFVFLFVGLGLVSLILGIMGLKKSKRAGRRNVFAVIGIIGGILEIIAAIGLSILFTMNILTAVDTCREYGSGTHTLIDGKVITCNV